MEIDTTAPHTTTTYEHFVQCLPDSDVNHVWCGWGTGFKEKQMAIDDAKASKKQMEAKGKKYKWRIRTKRITVDVAIDYSEEL